MRRIKLKTYLNIFYTLILLTGILPLILTINDYLTLKRSLTDFFTNEEKKVKSFLNIKQNFYVFSEYEIILQNGENLKLLYKSPGILTIGNIPKELTQKKKFLIDNRGKLWVKIKSGDNLFLIRYKNIPYIIKTYYNFPLRLVFSFLFTLTFLLLLYLTKKLFSGILLTFEEKHRNVTDFMEKLIEYPYFKEIEDLEKKRKIIDIAEGVFIISHEIKNAFQSLLTYLRLVKEKVGNDEIYNRVLEEIMEINTILKDYQEYILRDKKIEKEKINIKKLVEESIESLSLPDNITLESKIESKEIKANRILLKKAIINILKNSIESIENGGEIKIKGEIKERNYILEIEDTGRGMDKETLKRSTEPFFTTKARGLGLGLTFVEKIAEMHNAEFKIESEKNKGTKVKIIFKDG